VTVRPRLLDLFCGQGGCSVGYHRAGFDVTGVDIAAQPRYPFASVRAAAMGIDWMTSKGLTQAIPPAYTEFIGRQLIRILENTA